ncbi:GNAT family N-acetyltransferase [Nocardioidaceae bacterium]|nr:GNAT family N-acetyltransferase [Nocardioidaceae bacterium]
MSARLLTPAEVLTACDPGARDDAETQRRWRELSARAQVPNVFLTPELLLPALRHLARDRVGLAVVSRGGRWRLLVPLQLRTRPWHHPVRGATTWEHEQAFLGTPLISPDAEEEDWAELFGLVATAGDRWLVMRQVDTGVAEQVLAVADRLGQDGVVVRRTDRGLSSARDGERLHVDLSSKRRRELRRQRRRLDAKVGTQLVVEDLARRRPGEDTDARRARVRADLAHFLALERAGWKGEDGGAMAVRPPEAAFFVEACLAALDRGVLHLPALHDGSRPVAVAALVRDRDVVSWWKTTYDEAYAEFSPGWLVAVESFALLEDGVRVLDSCTDADSRLGTSLTSGRRELVTLAVSTRGSLGRSVVRRLPRWLAARARTAHALGEAAARVRRAPAGIRPSRPDSTTPV